MGFGLLDGEYRFHPRPLGVGELLKHGGLEEKDDGKTPEVPARDA
jgi:hypothetical protein